MSFLNPMAMAIAAGVTIPPLIALYFLKLKRNVRVVPTTLLWKRAVEDLHVNAPFQRLRASLLLLLQLLALIVAALALGKPLFKQVETHEETVILLIDQSASMGVVEEGGKTRLELAKEQAKRFVENMSDDARAMIIALCDRATVVSPFETDRRVLNAKIDTIEQTNSTTTLGEAMSLAEAYLQNMMIGLTGQPDIELSSEAAPATVAIFTDGKIEDADRVALQKLDADKMRVITIGKRGDNVGLLAMDARRHYERPEFLEIAATVRNFGPAAVTLDAVAYVDGTNVDVQTITLGPAPQAQQGSTGGSGTAGDGLGGSGTGDAIAGPDSTRIIVFDEIEFEGGGLVEVALRLDDALAADNKAWTIIEQPRHVSILLVTDGNMFLENAIELDALPIETRIMSGSEYEAADDDVLLNGERSAFDVVIFDGHSTDRLPQGNYMFWGAIPGIEGVSMEGVVENELIFNWDDTHPMLRYVAVEAISVDEWSKLTLPPETTMLMDGETTPVMGYLTRDASQYLIIAFRMVRRSADGDLLYNTYWGTSVDFLIFMQNALQYLASNIAVSGKKSVTPGEPVTLPIPKNTTEVSVTRPDKQVVEIPAAGYQSIHFADTRIVGPYTIDPGIVGHDTFAVNLFNAVESDTAPAKKVTVGATSVEAQRTEVEVSEPAWQYFLIAMLVLILLEWVVYNQRVFV